MPKDRNGAAQGYCLRRALAAVGIDLPLPAFVSRRNIAEICDDLGLGLTGYLAHEEDHGDPAICRRIAEEIAALPPAEQVIVVYRRAGGQGHAEYYRRLDEVPRERLRGLVIHGFGVGNAG